MINNKITTLKIIFYRINQMQNNFTNKEKKIKVKINNKVSKKILKKNLSRF